MTCAEDHRESVLAAYRQGAELLRKINDPSELDELGALVKGVSVVGSSPPNDFGAVGKFDKAKVIEALRSLYEAHGMEMISPHVHRPCMHRTDDYINNFAKELHNLMHVTKGILNPALAICYLKWGVRYW